MTDLTCPACQFTQEVPESVLSEDGTVVQCPECDSSYTALPSGMTLQPESDSSQLDAPENSDREAPFITDESESSTVDAATRQKVRRALERPNLSPLESELEDGGESPAGQALKEILPELEAEEKEELLREAARDGHVAAARTLLDSGVDPDATGEEGYAALHYAAKEGAADVARLLLEEWAEVDITDDNGKTPLHLAASENNLEVTELLLEAGADPNADFYPHDYRTPLHDTAHSGNPEVTELLLEARANPNATSAPYFTPLHYAASDTGGEEDNLEVAKLLLEAGADPSAGDESPIYFARAARYNEMVSLLKHYES